ncbi:MAG: hypothetical protein ACJ8DW_03745, partial [Microvirga sp.]
MADEDRRVLLIGRPADALLNWLARAKITTGAVFRNIDRWGTLESTALSPQAVNLILKKRRGWPAWMRLSSALMDCSQGS